MSGKIEEEEIRRWLAATADPSADITARAYSMSRLGHIGGKLPRWNRTQWHNLPAEYREFLVSIARLAIVNAHWIVNKNPSDEEKAP